MGATAVITAVMAYHRRLTTAFLLAPPPLFHQRPHPHRLQSSSNMGAGVLGAATLSSPETKSRYCTDHPENNVPPHIAELVGRDLHLIENHPIYIIRQKIQVWRWHRSWRRRWWWWWRWRQRQRQRQRWFCGIA